MFRSSFAQDIFNKKYAHARAETWEELAKTLAEDVVYEVVRDRFSFQEARMMTVMVAKVIMDMKFIPGGRYLYYAGRENKFFNNCLGGETKVLTDKGWAVLRDHAGQVLNVVSPVDGLYYPAEVKAHGQQKLNKITFASVRGKQDHTWTVRATRTHHWPLIDGTDTYDLRIGDVVPAFDSLFVENAEGFAHGFVYGDGNRHGQLRLCGKKTKWLSLLERVAKTVTYPASAEGEPVLYFGTETDWKSLPSEDRGHSYIGSFIQGWLAADGSETAGCKLHSVDKAALEWFADHAAYAGIVITGKLRSQVRNVSIGKYEYEGHEIFCQNYAWGSGFAGFKVVSIEADGVEEVYCPFEPVHNRIVIDHNIDTYQCYLLKAEEDSREDWAKLSWESEMCLMTGGGIGIDYSVYRPAGSPIKRTGGQASGPIPKMAMINEIGRNVMQGGSRRSAMYASLNWQHADAGAFLKIKDWHNMPVGSSGYTMADIKQQDFNFRAPMDMTNVSLNYDDAWLADPLKNGTFLDNVRQALRTGEPGFSFNFGEKQGETLRNACTEVTSEDDSDVCNLGSLNLSRIESIGELQSVVAAATLFLICGTMRADLPYQKVHEVRARNRRLGLGLMGVHEWLLKKGHRYEVVPELHDWLKVYKEHSDHWAAQWADKLDVSRPKAVRAIAPTGTIGILAGTTTGIEPLFAVAYKRRYLRNATEWHYQYVVDSAAQQVIDQFGIDPDKIESALDLAGDYERRIAFQADVQDYVDMAISSTINLPPYGSELNNDDMVDDFARTLMKYAPRLRGFTCYPDGSRGGQPLTSVPYREAANQVGIEFREHDVCDISGKGGVCGS